MIRFGIVGCGMIAGTHAICIPRVEHAVLRGVADVSFQRAEAFAKERNIMAYADYESMLADETIDAVCICTPSGLHAEQAIQALRAGKHVVLEKPMALCTADAEKICEEVKKSGKKLTVISQRRFTEDVQKVKSLLDAHAFGTVSLCDLYMKYWRDPSYYENSTWKGTFRMDGGGALMNQGIHGIDLMCYLLGEPKLIKGKVKTMVHKIEVEDTAVAMVEYPSGALGVIEGSTCARPGFSIVIEIMGDRGYVTLSDSSIKRLYLDGKMLQDNSIEIHSGTSSDPAKLQHERHTAQLLNFVRAIEEKEPLLIGPEEGTVPVRLIESIYNSSKEN